MAGDGVCQIGSAVILLKPDERARQVIHLNHSSVVETLAMTELNRKVLEGDIKSQLINYLKGKGWFEKKHALVNEFTIDGSSRRVDLCVFTEKHAYAFEIKSEADSLVRLEGQVSKYLDYFDKVIVVASKKHIENVLSKTPEDVAVWEASDIIKVIRRGKLSKKLDIAKNIEMMKVSDLKKLIAFNGGKGGNKTRKELEKEAIHASPTQVRSFTLSGIMDRYLLTTNNFWDKVKDNYILPENLSLLSMQKFYLSFEQKNLRKVLDLTVFYDDPHLITLSKNGKVFGEVPDDILKLL
ncbi:sce7726 family protein [Aeromonas oralensis]|uniref:sce7726 family protein n=1 Tax=Aeromonas oralensis TaxID=3415010 RepID=UPI003D4A7053